MCFGSLGDDSQNLLDDLRVQYRPLWKGNVTLNCRLP
jgi:hypothetical protein